MLGASRWSQTRTRRRKMKRRKKKMRTGRRKRETVVVVGPVGKDRPRRRESRVEKRANPESNSLITYAPFTGVLALSGRALAV